MQLKDQTYYWVESGGIPEIVYVSTCLGRFRVHRTGDNRIYDPSDFRFIEAVVELQI